MLITIACVLWHLGVIPIRFYSSMFIASFLKALKKLSGTSGAMDVELGLISGERESLCILKYCDCLSCLASLFAAASDE